jgi:hypothetical protein
MSEHDQRDDYDDEPERGRLASKGIVAWPASAMWVFGLMQCVFAQIFVAFWGYLFVSEGLEEGKSLAEIIQQILAQEEAVVAIVCWPIATACTLVVMQGANNLRRFQRYPLVAIGAVLTFLSIPLIHLGVLGIPLAIWLMVLLIRRDVRARFEAVARGTIPTHSNEVPNARSDRSS